MKLIISYKCTSLLFLVLKKILMWNRKGAWGQQLTIIGWGWAKYRDLSVASRLIIANNWSMRHWQITIFCNNRVQLSFSQWVCFFNEYLAFCHFYTKLIARRRKAWFHLCMSRVLFVAKHSWTTLPMSRPLFVYSYLQVTCVVGSLPMKRKKYLHQMII